MMQQCEENLDQFFYSGESNMQHGVWKHQCIICNQLFSSSQAIAGHTKIHYKDGWVKGTHQKKVFVPFPDYQQPQSSTTIDPLTYQQQQIFSTKVTDTDSPNSHQLGSSSPVLAPPDTDSPNSHQLGSSSPVVSPPDTDSPNSHQLGSSFQ
ncbi:hypothetical protein H5410_007118 [Solanum commersonii]|uniref:C2H2-type domain-containing protein n=1 Tax=Solanum commersonii TaxID=4109 RepID=A0A9J6AC60_SOLCO|nr:hypothetical protein H5410_007118 [Solanum commersonii]